MCNITNFFGITIFIFIIILNIFIILISNKYLNNITLAILSSIQALVSYNMLKNDKRVIYMYIWSGIISGSVLCFYSTLPVPEDELYI
jgi:uncharacterized membrane protein